MRGTAITLLALVFVAAPAVAADDCVSASAVAINVAPVFDDPKYDFNASLADIQKLAADSRSSIRESLPLGVTHYTSSLELRTPIDISEFSDGTSCVRIRRADVSFGYRDVTVSIAREIAQGSCGFDEVMAHEQKHIAVNRQVLDEYVPRIREKLAASLAVGNAFAGGDPESQVRLVQQNLQAILNDLGEEMMNENAARQSAVDSPEEYQRLARVCGGQLARVDESSLGGYR